MKIAQLSPLYESVPPKLYGGTERVVSYLTEELVRQGHEVTLYASGDSVTQAELRAITEEGLRLLPRCEDQIAPHVLLLETLAQEADRYDIIHSHIETLPFPLFRRSKWATLATCHGNLGWPEVAKPYTEFADQPLVSISGRQREPLPFLNWIGTVHHGLPKDLLVLEPKPGSYLAFLGRVAHEKRLDRAIEIALKAEMPLKIAAKVGTADLEYYRQHIVPLLQHPLIEFVGEISEQEKQELLGGAAALLFPIDWREPFGLAMIEAMATGTPVIAWNQGSVPEVVEPGVSGFIVNSTEEAVRVLAEIGSFDRVGCRAAFERRFTAERMAREYLEIYESLVDWRVKHSTIARFHEHVQQRRWMGMSRGAAGS